MESFLTGLVSGGALWEGAKFVGRHFFNQWSEKNRGQRKLLLADVERLATTIEPLCQRALAYYGAPSADGTETARKIRMELRTFAMHFGSVNDRLRALGQPAMASALLISFRQALTNQIDVSRASPLAIDDPVVNAIFKSTRDLHDTLTALRYELV